MNKAGPSQVNTRKRKLKSEDVTNEEKVKTTKKKVKTGDVEFENYNNTEWSEHELLAEQAQLDLNISQNIVNLFKEGNTIPFIARYRKAVTGNMSPEILRDVKECYEEILALKSKIATVTKAVVKLGHTEPKLIKTIQGAKSLEELEHIYAPYKPGGKRTLAERAKELGLEEPAMALLKGPVNLFKYVVPDKKELQKIEDVEKGVMHIIAAVISTDTDLLAYLRELRGQVHFVIETKKSTSKTDKPVQNGVKNVDENKFQNYFDFKIPLKFIKPHQVLAINRGEHLKFLSVKVVVPEYLFHKFSNFCTNKWVKTGIFENTRKRILEEAIQDSYTRLVQPLVVREIRSELRTKAEKASNEVFCTNLKHLLLAPPLKGRTILAVDPGFSNGCKLAIISPTGSLLSHNIIYPHKNKSNCGRDILRDMLLNFDCNLVAIGNGTACRETEEWLSKLIQNNLFSPLDVTYTIVNEDGASIYSCSKEAKKEFSDVDPNIISAISLARRLQDPLAELVKIEPQHLGVGMYQHDLKKKQLEETLDEVVSECVSFVGVDLNTASQCLLRRVAGLSEKRATNIIEYREENGPFTFRKQLKEVKGIGAKIFEQCAGFLRVGPLNAKEADKFYKKANTIKLDCTYIHPESYDLTKKVLKLFQLKLTDVGTDSFINSIKEKMTSVNIAELSVKFDSTEETIKLILDALSKPLNHDLRSEIDQKPLFKKGLTSIYDISIGTVLTGRINNVTHFGCFVDIGVGINGLIHSSKLNGFNLQIGDKVEVEVINLEIDKKRIQLAALKKL